ncbi:uncharacterized protein MONBRDRAFT_7344 [Monosiga brevicollis MX1]|uniref:Uncharacterized protein n=1 Tax=Monosiga brevicollis TaxID=81824 RepID=A9UWP2_MONBE|nr:uncharacterized protein MONBRDRAFT_7344 [Monosiga brevicollis MX1]EDQ90079.1 predicted protein [Monosiga brevicollis MX1]|eukprot:XP_001744846.1 hypothetical protein [Monosiga brevicollis MX1]
MVWAEPVRAIDGSKRSPLLPLAVEVVKNGATVACVTVPVGRQGSEGDHVPTGKLLFEARKGTRAGQVKRHHSHRRVYQKNEPITPNEHDREDADPTTENHTPTSTGPG